MADDKSQIKSKERVRERGEVFTAEREVKAMVDLVGDPASNPMAGTVLEPACGDGNFLVEILNRKCDRLLAMRKWKWQQADLFAFQLASVLTLLYGIDIMHDNVVECRRRLIEIILERFDKLVKGKDPLSRKQLESAADVIAEINIVRGNALTMKTECENPSDAKPLVFVKWRSQMVRDKYFFGVTPYYFDELVNGDKNGGKSLFEIKEPLKASGQIPFRQIGKVHEFMKGVAL